MTVAAVTMVKDEADVIEGVLAHMVDEVDFVIVADNLSTDATRPILDRLAGHLPIEVVDDPDPAYRQSEKMTALAARAAEQGAEWIVPFDADEIWYSEHGRIRTVLADTSATVAHAPLYNHFASGLDPDGCDPFATMVWRQRKPGPLPKVAFRWHPDAVIAQGNHAVKHPASTVARGLMEVRHFPYRSAEQMVRKARNGAAAYRAGDFRKDMGAHWRSYGEILDRHGEEALRDVFREHFWHLSPVDAGLVHDPAPYRRWT